jgi:rubrerythrin
VLTGGWRLHLNINKSLLLHASLKYLIGGKNMKESITENEAVYGGTDYTEHNVKEYRCNQCSHVFELEDLTCPQCNSADWTFSPGGVAWK